jgi:hypothetical protein
VITVKRNVAFVRRPDRSQAMVVSDGQPKVVPSGRVPRISRLMALAIHFDRLVREGKVADLSELARLAHVTQPRMTQIMNLNHLAPDIQEQLLFLPPPAQGRPNVYERHLRSLVCSPCWRAQRTGWASIATNALTLSGPRRHNEAECSVSAPSVRQDGASESARGASRRRAAAMIGLADSR